VRIRQAINKVRTKLSVETRKTDNKETKQEIELVRKKAEEAYEVLKKPDSRVLYDHLGVVPSDCEECLGYMEWFLYVYMKREFGSFVLMLIYSVLLTSSSTGFCI